MNLRAVVLVCDLSDQDVDVHERAVLYCLARYANRDGVAWPSLSTICDGSSVGRRTAQRVLRRLVERGLLEEVDRSVGGSQRTSRYRLANSVTVTPLANSVTVTPFEAHVTASERRSYAFPQVTDQKQRQSDAVTDQKQRQSDAVTDQKQRQSDAVTQKQRQSDAVTALTASERRRYSPNSVRTASETTPNSVTGAPNSVTVTPEVFRSSYEEGSLRARARTRAREEGAADAPPTASPAPGDRHAFGSGTVKRFGAGAWADEQRAQRAGRQPSYDDLDRVDPPAPRRGGELYVTLAADGRVVADEVEPVVDVEVRELDGPAIGQTRQEWREADW